MSDYAQRLQEFKKSLAERGVSASDVAREHGLRPNDVHKVLSGFLKCKRGIGHNVAVKLGLKDGVVT